MKDGLQCRNSAFTDEKEIRDLCDICIDTSLPVTSKIKAFTGQIKNPYVFMVGDVKVRIEFSGGRSFSDAVAAALNTG